MTLLALGLLQRSTDLDLFGRTAVSADARPKILHALVDCDDVRQAVVLSTCMRTEFYVEVDRYHAAFAQVRDVIALYAGLAPDAVGDQICSLYDDAGVQHLFEVASGMDSAVLGEGEILRQVREAWEAAVAAKTVGPALACVFRRAIEVAKRVRTETAIARGTTSIAEAAVDLAQSHGVRLELAAVLVVGAGDMAAGVVRALTHRGATNVTVTNRTHKSAAELADSYGAKTVPFANLAMSARTADFVISSTSSPHPLIYAEDLLTTGSPRRTVLLDAGVPRDIDPLVAEYANVELLTIDDLRRHAEQGRDARTAQVDAAREIVADELSRFANDQRGRLAVPVVRALRQRGEDIRESELERFAAKLATLNSDQRAVVDALTSAIMNKVLHEPTVQLKAWGGTEEGERLAAALRDVFGLYS